MPDAVAFAFGVMVVSMLWQISRQLDRIIDLLWERREQ